MGEKKIIKKNMQVSIYSYLNFWTLPSHDDNVLVQENYRVWTTSEEMKNKINLAKIGT